MNFELHFSDDFMAGEGQMKGGGKEKGEGGKQIIIIFG